MAGQSLIYSNARVKAMENSLLTSEKITRMAYSDNLLDAVKILYESNYGGGTTVDNPYAYGEILRMEEKRVVDFVREAMPDKSGLQTLLYINDYHNAKCYLKGKFAKDLDLSLMLLPAGNIDLSVIEESIQKEDLTKLPQEMANAIKEIEEIAREDKVSPRYIDITLDKAMYKDILFALKRVNVKSLTKYWKTNIDFINVSTMLRCKRIDADLSFLKENLIDGGEINDYVLEGLYKESYDVIAEKLKYTAIGDIIAVGASEAKAGKALVQYEVLWDNYLLNIFKDDRADVFSIAPIAGFYIAKKIEIKMVRMILTCLKNHADLQNIKARLRGFYA
ncbi:MAG: V-type ATPase subunit [Clostridia bacterium]|nr:V-type ATPase subunit [Clostridia bacterium]